MPCNAFHPANNDAQSGAMVCDACTAPDSRTNAASPEKGGGVLVSPFKGGFLMDDDAESAAFAACPAVPAYPLTTLSPYLSREEVSHD